jgi:hypothetical protein
MITVYGPSWEKPGMYNTVMDHESGETLLHAAIEKGFEFVSGNAEIGIEKEILKSPDMLDTDDGLRLQMTSSEMREVEQLLTWYGQRTDEQVTAIEENTDIFTGRRELGSRALDLAAQMEVLRKASELRVLEDAYKRLMIEDPKVVQPVVY